MRTRVELPYSFLIGTPAPVAWQVKRPDGKYWGGDGKAESGDWQDKPAPVEGRLLARDAESVADGVLVFPGDKFPPGFYRFRLTDGVTGLTLHHTEPFVIEESRVVIEGGVVARGMVLARV